MKSKHPGRLRPQKQHGPTTGSRINRLTLFGDRGDRDCSPEENLLIAIITRAAFDACNVHDTQATPFERRRARKWFRDKRFDYIGGWGYCHDELQLPDWMIERIEDMVAGKLPPHERDAMLNALASRCKVKLG